MKFTAQIIAFLLIPTFAAAGELTIKCHFTYLPAHGQTTLKEEASLEGTLGGRLASVDQEIGDFFVSISDGGHSPFIRIKTKGSRQMITARTYQFLKGRIRNISSDGFTGHSVAFHPETRSELRYSCSAHDTRSEEEIIEDNRDTRE
jgi:hypothetical protein